MPFVDDQNRSNRLDVSDSNAMTVVGVVALIVVVIIGGAIYAMTIRSNHAAVMVPKAEMSFPKISSGVDSRSEAE
jgi:hypothetical protein